VDGTIGKEGETMKRIVNSKELSEIVGRDRTRLYRLIKEERLKPQYVDREGKKFWTMKRALEIKQMIEEQGKTRKPGRGGKIVLEKPSKG
jgi:hypothetical protein